MGDFRMPTLGADMEAGTLVEWLKHAGDAVKRGDIIAVVDTQKGAIEIEVFESGVLEKTMVAPGEKVPVGTVLAVIRGAGPEPPEPRAVAPPPALPSAPAPGPAPPLAVSPSARLRISPLARQRAADLGVDPAQVKGSGPQGAIDRDDVERAAALAAAVPAQPSGGDRTAAMRAAIAAAMATSKREIPHYYLATTIDMTAALAWLRTENEKRSMPERLLPAVLLLKAVAMALREVPELNGHWVDGGFRRGAGVHVGCAIWLRGGGLVAPALHDADKADLSTLMRIFQDLVARARGGALRSSELADPTITVTNLGEQGVESAFGIIYPPQVALVGFGKISERPWVGPEKIEARPLLHATLSADHRASDGHRGAIFLATIDRLVQSPETL